MILSIIVLVYSVENYVEECVKSLCSQSIKDIEIIVVDDGSTDNSINKVKDNGIKIIPKKMEDYPQLEMLE